MADKKPNQESLDDEVRARLYFYDQLAAPFPASQRIRRDRPIRKRMKMPKDVAEQFIERVGLAQEVDESPEEHIPVHVSHVKTSPLANNGEVALTPPVIDDELQEYDVQFWTKVRAGLKVFRAIPVLPFTALRSFIRRVGRDSTHYVVAVNGPEWQTVSFKRIFMTVLLIILWSAAAIAVYFYLQRGDVIV